MSVDGEPDDVPKNLVLFYLRSLAALYIQFVTTRLSLYSILYSLFQ